MADVPNYPGNSKTTREPKVVPAITNVPTPEEPKAEKVIEGSARLKKPSVAKRFRESLAGDDAQTVGQYVLFEVIVPALKATINDIVSQGVERMLYGDSSRTRPTNGRRQYTSYSQPSQSNIVRPEPRQGPVTNVKGVQNFDELILETRGDAELVLEKMMDQLKDYEQVTVANLYDFCGVTAMSSFTDNRWGWVDLRGAAARRIPGSHGGYILDLPRPIDLGR